MNQNQPKSSDAIELVAGRDQRLAVLRPEERPGSVAASVGCRHVEPGDRRLVRLTASHAVAVRSSGTASGSEVLRAEARPDARSAPRSAAPSLSSVFSMTFPFAKRDRQLVPRLPTAAGSLLGDRRQHEPDAACPSRRTDTSTSKRYEFPGKR